MGSAIPSPFGKRQCSGVTGRSMGIYDETYAWQPRLASFSCLCFFDDAKSTPDPPHLKKHAQLRYDSLNCLVNNRSGTSGPAGTFPWKWIRPQGFGSRLRLNRFWFKWLSSPLEMMCSHLQTHTLPCPDTSTYKHTRPHADTHRDHVAQVYK